MKIAHKIAILFLILITVVSFIIKGYFMPIVDGYLELSVQDQMMKDMAAFEKVIHVVVSAADTNHEVVRRALRSITTDENIPVVLKRSGFIARQFGYPDHMTPYTDTEEKVIESGEAVFLKNDEFYEYYYPLRAVSVCRNCHFEANGDPVKPGTVLGVAVKKVPESVLRDASLTYFVMDLFAENLLMVTLIVIAVLLCVYFWMLKPLYRLTGLLKPVYIREEYEFHESADEFENIENGIKYLMNGENSIERKE